ncbi:unnamed protein product, partial [Ectocarpus fasciculatus]
PSKRQRVRGGNSGKQPKTSGGGNGSADGGVGSGESSFSTGTPLSPSKAVNRRPRRDNVRLVDYSVDNGSGLDNDDDPGWGEGAATKKPRAAAGRRRQRGGGGGGIGRKRDPSELDGDGGRVIDSRGNGNRRVGTG